MEIKQTDQVPDDTYFRVGEAEPEIDGNEIVVLNGQGTRRSWGAPQVNTTVLVEDCDFVACLIGFSHKHRGGQFYRYYIENGKGPQRVTWSKLTDDERRMVLDAYEEKAPHWARRPGKLRSEYRKPKTTKFTAYKIMRQVSDTEFLSLYDETKWTLGKRNGEAVGDDAVRYAEHSGGFYVHKDADRIKALWESKGLVPDRCYTDDDFVLIECECYGRQAHFSSGKVAVTYCTPVKVLETV
jgi:hypothetical protein